MYPEKSVTSITLLMAVFTVLRIITVQSVSNGCEDAVC